MTSSGSRTHTKFEKGHHDFSSKILFNKIDTFLTRVDSNSKEELKEENRPESSAKIKRNTMFENLRKNQYNKRGLDLRKNFCHQLTTKRIIINMNTPQIIQREAVKSVSVSI